MTTPAASVAATSIADVDGLASGAFAEVVTSDLVHRSAPEISDSSLIVGALNAPTRVYIEDGPVLSDGYRWFLVQVEGTTTRGWVAEAGKDGEVWLAPADPPTSATWTEVGSIDVGPLPGGLFGLTSFDGGYIAWGKHGTGESGSGDVEFATWFSPDGITWEMAVHSVPVSPCPGWTERPNLDAAYASATDGETIVLMASVLDSPTRTTCDQMQLVALSTSDGVNWDRSEPFGEGWSESAWTIPGGFEVHSNGTVWRSRDGQAWNIALTGGPTGLLDHPGGARFLVGGTDAEGTRLAAWGGSLLASRDAEPWRDVAALPDGYYATHIVPPARQSQPWLVTVESPTIGDPALGEARVLTSTDLVTWESGSMPTPGVAAIIAMADGWLAIGYTPIGVVGCGSDCPTQDPGAYWSADADTWTELIPPDPQAVAWPGLSGIAPGPVGIIAFGATSGRYPVWRLIIS